MKTASLLSTALVLGLSAGSAFAGGFVGLGIGSPSKLELDDNLGAFASDGRSGKLFGGYRFPVQTGYIAVEGSYTGFGLMRNGNTFDGRTLGLAAKYNHKLSDGFELFGRLGVQQTSLDASTGSFTFDGTGLLVGAGAEYHLPIKLPVDSAIYIDGTYSSFDLARSDNNAEHSANDLVFSLGVVVGF
ncbi:MAG TPA: outer membrane beta-barrel protein [Kofleriaceae bacterium]|nr:outer membrane beta-barrel protein [Kofleriaceae bacterium]